MTPIEKLDGLIDKYISDQPTAQLRALDEGSFTHAIESAIEIIEGHNPWISVNTPPDPDRDVLIIDSNGNAVVGYFWDGKAWNSYSDIGLVNAQYWMDIPKSAKQ